MVDGEVCVEVPHEFGIVEKNIYGAKRGSERTKNVFKWEVGEVLEGNEVARNDGEG